MQDLQGRSITIDDVHDDQYVIDMGGELHTQYDLQENSLNSSDDGLLQELQVTSKQLKATPIISKKMEPLGFVTTIGPTGKISHGKILHQASYKPPPPDNYLLLSCIVMFCCNPPFGMLALFYSVKTTKSHEDEEFTLSKNQSRMSRRISLMGVLITFIIVITLVILFWPQNN